jgi:hypothetical protein
METAIELLKDILNETEGKTEISLQRERLIELLDLLTK